MVLYVVLLFLSSLLFAYIYLQYRYTYWKRRNVPYLSPPSIIFGNADDIFTGKKCILQYILNVYFQIGPEKLLGIYMFQKPTLYISDLNWIKHILTKDFHSFYDRGLHFDTETEPLTKHLFHLEGENWIYMRKKLMPHFSNDGIKQMFPLLMRSAMKMKNYVSRQPLEDLNMTDILSRYAADVIGECAFGIDSGSLADKTSKFYIMSKRIFEPRIRTMLKLMWPNLPNFVAQTFDIKMVPTDISDYFVGIIETEMEYRRVNNIVKDDFLENMINLQQEVNTNCSTSKEMITNDLVIAHCFMFFIAGYENASSILCTLLLQLSQNPGVQEKLYQEIHQFCVFKGSLNLQFDVLHQMTYLDMVVSEALRRYPPATALIRECKKDYVLPGSDIKIDKGVQIVIPICGLHHDNKYFPNEEIFNPENFNDKASATRTAYTYMPFGAGPRTCIGKRFGIMQVKVALVTLIFSYMFVPSSKMIFPLTFNAKTFIVSVKGGTWITFKPRIQESE